MVEVPYENFVAFMDGHIEEVLFFKRYLKDGYGVIVDFYTVSGKYRYISPFKQPDGTDFPKYTPHHYLKSVIHIDSSGECSELWIPLNMCEGFFLKEFIETEVIKDA